MKTELAGPLFSFIVAGHIHSAFAYSDENGKGMITTVDMDMTRGIEGRQTYTQQDGEQYTLIRLALMDACYNLPGAVNGGEVISYQLFEKGEHFSMEYRQFLLEGKHLDLFEELHKLYPPNRHLLPF